MRMVRVELGDDFCFVSDKAPAKFNKQNWWLDIAEDVESLIDAYDDDE